ncbi:helix-turn-helix domain-containing protein [Streptomyces platensis]|uniref:helix-turn-helix domain-containing protein n=1 Tax=Streptomyces platensis TaxID=58346 RepID=UPI00331CE3F2
MNTTAAALQANVTVATIRNWCRRGVIAATKQAGRWIIDTASLAHRITIGHLKRPAPKPAKVAYTVENMLAIGGNRWTKAGFDRVYLNNWAEFAGLDVSHYGTGNVSSASLGGHGIANGRVAGIMQAVHKVYFDAADGKLYVSHTDADCYEIRYLDGTRSIVNFVQRISAGVRAAIAAL